MAVTRVVMPKLSEAMETGKVIKWIKKEGDRVNGGDILAEIETDKADVEMEAFGAGVLRKILVKEGDTAPVGVMIAVIAEPSEDISSVAGDAGAAPAAAAASAPAAPTPAPAAGTGPSPRPAAVPPQPRTEDHATVAKTEPAARSSAGSAAANTQGAAPTTAGAPGRSQTIERGEAPERASEAPEQGSATATRIKASPLARKVAAQSGLDLRLVSGSGPGGRIVRKDVEAAAGAPAPAGAPMRVAAATAGPEFEDRPLSQMR